MKRQGENTQKGIQRNVLVVSWLQSDRAGEPQRSQCVQRNSCFRLSCCRELNGFVSVDCQYRLLERQRIETRNSLLYQTSDNYRLTLSSCHSAASTSVCRLILEAGASQPLQISVERSEQSLDTPKTRLDMFRCRVCAGPPLRNVHSHSDQSHGDTML